MDNGSRGTRFLIFGAGAAALLAAGLYYVTGPMKCQGLEEDHLNAVSSLRSTAALEGITLGDREVEDGLKRIEKLERQRIQTTLMAVYDQCGSRAGQTAARKSSEMLLRT